MKRLTSNTPATVLVEFSVAGEPVVPDNEDFTWTLVTETGTIVNSRSDVSGSVAAGMTEAEIALDATDTSAAKDYDLRLLTVSFLYDGNPHSAEIYFALHDFVFIPVAPQRVRTLLSLQTNELPDEDINLLAGYYMMLDDLTQASVDAARTAGGLQSMAVDQLTAVYAAMDFLPSLKLRVLRSQSDGELRYQRFDLDKVESIGQDLADRAADYRNQALAVSDDDAADEAVYLLAATTAPGDVIVGEAT